MEFKPEMEVVCIRKQTWRILTAQPPHPIKYGEIVTISQLIRKDILFLEFKEYQGCLYGAGNFVPLDMFTEDGLLEEIKEMEEVNV